MNCSATLHEMCMNIVGVMNEQVVFCLNIFFFCSECCHYFMWICEVSLMLSFGL